MRCWLMNQLLALKLILGVFKSFSSNHNSAIGLAANVWVLSNKKENKLDWFIEDSFYQFKVGDSRISDCKNLKNVPLFEALQLNQ